MNLLNARKKLVTMAVATAISGGVMVSAPAHAMNVSQNNVGQVLLFPYYTVKNNYDTLFSVVNTTNKTAVFKIRWREALNSRETRDFNVVLSPYDVWNGVVTKDDGGTGAVIRTWDKTCTSPVLGSGPNGSTQIAMTSLAYDGTDSRDEYGLDGGGTGMARVQEGYFEVILMGVSTVTASTTNNAFNVEYNAKHVNGVPRDCSKVDSAFTNIPVGFVNFTTPENVLKGHSTFINVAQGKAIDATPAHVENFVTVAGDYVRPVAGQSHIVYAPSDLSPDLSSGNITDDALRFIDGALATSPYYGSEWGVSELLAANAIINEFASGTGAETDWVVTFPTKHHFTDRVLEVPGQRYNYPFYQQFDYVVSSSPTEVLRGKSCDNVQPVYYDREERTATPTGTLPSPAPQGSSMQLCYEANVLSFNGSNVFGAGVNRQNVDTSSVGTAGWMQLNLNVTETINTLSANYNNGDALPVIGFAAITRNNASEAGNNRNYGSAEEHTIVSGSLNATFRNDR